MNIFISADLIAAVVGALLTAVISVLIFIYTHRKAKLEFLIAYWKSQQDINILMLSSDRNLEDYECIVYGQKLPITSEIRQRWILFLTLNRINLLYLSARMKIVPWSEANAEIDKTLSLIKRQEETVLFLLKNRGYTERFYIYIQDRLKNVNSVPLETTGIK